MVHAVSMSGDTSIPGTYVTFFFASHVSDTKTSIKGIQRTPEKRRRSPQEVSRRTPIVKHTSSTMFLNAAASRRLPNHLPAAIPTITNGRE